MKNIIFYMLGVISVWVFNERYFSITTEAIVFVSTNTGNELKNILDVEFNTEHFKNSSEIFSSNESDIYLPVSLAEKNIQGPVKKEEVKTVNKSEAKSLPSELDLKRAAAPRHDDIPSFSEWTEKQLTEAEKKRNDENAAEEKFKKQKGKFRNKNYASPDCGAKIVASNPESVRPSSLLSSLKDEYMLNYCTDRIWFIVELCETIQAKQLDLANFELFSSSPKHFSVSVSHRFPTREWSKVGMFMARDSRDVQSFNLYPHLFAKFIKFEMHSHYRQEQLCLISWVGVYGTSELEVLAKEDERNLLADDDDDDEDEDGDDEDAFSGDKQGDSSKSLLGIATNAVLSIVKQASPRHEEIPSCNDWSEKWLTDTETTEINENAEEDKFKKQKGKFRNKNYASPDCGAKIVASNPESVRPSSLLSSLKDEYMLNYCTDRIWFIVELCETIQAKQLDLANFELFSSSPKHFSVSVSHRFPTREWTKVGVFMARDSRDIQTFNLYPHLFAKFIKFEMHSHYRREQLCLISWVGVYGTSELEVLAKEDERNLLADDDDDDDDGAVDLHNEAAFVSGDKQEDSSKSLLSIATNAVLSIVQQATAPFLKAENNETRTQNFSLGELNFSRESCFCPRYIVVCNNCTQNFYDTVFYRLSCEYSVLEGLMSVSFVKNSLVHGDSCIKLGLDFSNERKGAPFPWNFMRTSEQGVKYLTAIFENSFIAAMCNVLAVTENKVVMNSTVQSIPTLNNRTQEDYCNEVEPTSYSSSSTFVSKAEYQNDTISAYTDSIFTSATSSSSFYFSEFHSTTSRLPEVVKPSEGDFSKIEPTKTLNEHEVEILQSSESDSVISDSIVESIGEETSTKSTLQDSYVTRTTVPSLLEEKSLPLKEAENGSQNVDNTGTGEVLKEFDSEDTTTTTNTTTTTTNTTINSDTSTTNTTNTTTTTTEEDNLMNQDSSLESIISDLNAIERVVNSPSSTFTTSTLPGESIFLRLANRIKNLEINMSLTSTYLEELSRRCRMQLELNSKSLNLTIQKIEENSRIEEEKERIREEEILLLRMQLANLTKDVSTFIREQSSWRAQVSSVCQHFFLISVEFVVIWMIVSHCKRPAESVKAVHKSEPAKRLGKKFKRRNSLEGQGHEMPRRKIRRPSDEALEVALSRSHKEKKDLKID